jgi:hypothetical protein
VCNFASYIAVAKQGWDTTLAHRRLVAPWESLGAFEALHLEQHTGVPVYSEDADVNFANSGSEAVQHGLESDGVDARDNSGGGGDVSNSSTFSSSTSSSLEAYLDAWNDAVLSSCDVIAVFPATAGRVADYCAHGVKARRQRPAAAAATGAGPAADGGSESAGAARAVAAGSDRCDVVDARGLSGVAQLVDSDTWLRELRGVRVLVVSPFARTIAKQYAKHRALLRHPSNRGNGGLFPGNPYALPEFASLRTLEPPVGGSRGKWRAAVASTQAQLRAVAGDFDVALVSSGGWGPLLQAFIARDLNKSSVYLGGSLQLHFGVWGGRFFNSSSLASALATPDWTWPEKVEAEAVQSGIVLAGLEYTRGYAA